MIARPHITNSVALDASIFIYYLENHPHYAALANPYFDAHDRGQLRIVTSAVTLLEVLVRPLRYGDLEVVAQYEDMLSGRVGIWMIDIDRDQLMLASRLRAEFRLKTADALQLAAAIATGCTQFITNDKRIPSIPGIEVVQLDNAA